MVHNLATAIIGFPRFTAQAVFSGITPGSFDPRYPVAHLGVLPLSRVARTVDLDPSHTRFRFDLDPPRSLRLLVLCRHNLSEAARYRIRLYGDSALVTLLRDSGWMDVWEGMKEAEEQEWEDDGLWTGTLSYREIKGYPWYRPFRVVDGEYTLAGTVEIQDSQNPDGYVQVGLCELADAWPLSTNPEVGAEHGFKSRTLLQESDGGTEYFRRRPKSRLFTGTVAAMATPEAMGKGFEHQRLHDIDEPFFWWPNPLDNENLVRDAFLARNLDLGLLKYVGFNLKSLPLSLKEVL